MASTNEGRKEGREGGSEGGRKGGRKEGRREGGREGWRKEGRERREGRREGGREEQKYINIIQLHRYKTNSSGRLPTGHNICCYCWSHLPMSQHIINAIRKR